MNFNTWMNFLLVIFFNHVLKHYSIPRWLPTSQFYKQPNALPLCYATLPASPCVYTPKMSTIYLQFLDMLLFLLCVAVTTA